MDCKTKERDTEEPDVGEQMGASESSAATTTSRGPSNHFHLGAPEKKDKSLLELTGTTILSIPNLLQILGVFINKFRTGEEGYYRVRKDDMVSLFTPFRPTGN